MYDAFFMRFVSTRMHVIAFLINKLIKIALFELIRQAFKLYQTARLSTNTHDAHRIKTSKKSRSENILENPFSPKTICTQIFPWLFMRFRVFFYLSAQLRQVFAVINIDLHSMWLRLLYSLNRHSCVAFSKKKSGQFFL